MFQRALVCTDFSDSLYLLARVVPSLAAGGLRHITFFHNVAVQTDRGVPRVDPGEIEASRQRLENALTAIPEGIEVKVQVEGGRPSENILKLVEKTRAEVVFLGMPTRTLLTEKLFGSTTMNLIEHTPVPFMILRPHLVSTYTTEELSLRCKNLFRYWLVPYDGTEGARKFLTSLKHHIQTTEHPTLERCLILWVVDDSIRRELRGDNPLQDAEQHLHEIGADLRELGLRIDTLVREGDPLAEILLAAEDHDISAIATCSRGIGGFMRWSVPSLTRDILRQSWHPVLYFPPATKEP